MKKICFLSSRHDPKDKRIFEKQAKDAFSWGYDVTHLATGDKNYEIIEDGVRVIVFQHARSILGRLTSIRRLYKKGIDLDCDLYHCNEIDSWFVGILIKWRHKKRVIFDVHEHYPSTFIEGRIPKIFEPIAILAFRILYKTLVPATDRIVFAKNSVSIDFPRQNQPAQYVLVRNYAPTSLLDVENDGLRSYEGKTVAVHTGLISKQRGWPQLLEALENNRKTNLEISVIGEFSDKSDMEFYNQVALKNLTNIVSVKKWMPPKDAFKEIISAHIGLILFQPGITNHTYALPHKLFDYMLAGLAIIAPQHAVEVEEIVVNSNCGLLVDTSKPTEIYQAINSLMENPEEMRKMGERGQHAVKTRYNWESESERLKKVYSDLLGET